MSNYPITKDQLINASEDAVTLEHVVNDAANTGNPGHEDGTVTSRLGTTMNNLAHAIQKIAESGGTIGKQTLALLNADLNWPADTVAFVSNDPTASNNGFYIKAGASGSGSWTKSAYDRNVTLDQIATLQQFDAKPIILFNGNDSSLYPSALPGYGGVIKVNQYMRRVTFPNGMVTYPGVSDFWLFPETTLTFDASNGRWSTFYFDIKELTNNTGNSPFKIVQSASPTPPVDPFVITLGTIYAAEYQSDFPFKYVNEGRVSRKLRNMLPGGDLAEGGKYSNIFGVGSITGTDSAKLEDQRSSAFGLLGVQYAFRLTKDAPQSKGCFVDSYVSTIDASEHTGGYNVFASVLVFPQGSTDPSAWDACTPILYVTSRNKTGGSESVAVGPVYMTDFIQILSGVRLYWCNATLPVIPTSGIGYYALRVGARIPEDHTGLDYLISGFFATMTNESQRMNNKLTPDDVDWSAWGDCVGPLSSINASKIADLQSTVASIQSNPVVRTTGLRKLADDLQNPLHSIMIRLIGDSITWGVGASNTGPSDPRNHQLTDPRANLICLSWANRLRDWLGKTYASSATPVVNNVPGSGYYDKVHVVDPTVPNSNFRFYHPKTGVQIPFSVLNVRPYPNCYFGRCMDFWEYANAPIYANYNASIEFDIYGDNFTVVFSGQNIGSTTAICGVYVDSVRIGQFLYSTVNAFQQRSPQFTMAMGQHKVQLRNEGTPNTDDILRLEGIQVNRRIQVANDGIIGTATTEWQGTNDLLSGALQAGDEYVFCQLGTNDREITNAPQDAQRVYDALRITGNYCRNLGKQFILMSSNTTAADYDAATTGMFFTQGEIDRVIYDLSQEMQWDFISNYKASIPAWLWNSDSLFNMASDTIHPNDSGHGIIAQNIIDRINAAIKPLK